MRSYCPWTQGLRQYSRFILPARHQFSSFFASKMQDAWSPGGKVPRLCQGATLQGAGICQQPGEQCGGAHLHQQPLATARGRCWRAYIRTADIAHGAEGILVREAQSLGRGARCVRAQVCGQRAGYTLLLRGHPGPPQVRALVQGFW